LQPLGENRRQSKMDMNLLADAQQGSLVVGSGYFIKTADKNSMLSSASSHMGFEASKLVVNGNLNLDINVLQARLATQLGNSLFSFKVDAARDEVLNDPWVKSATVRKVYPDTIVVDVIERKPVALWQSKGEVHLISVVSRFPTISRKASAYVRVAGRRWNVRLHDGPQVLLPESDWQVALSELQGLQASKELLDRDILQIDMRLSDRLVIKLDPEVAEIRKTAIQKALKRDWHKT